MHKSILKSTLAALVLGGLTTAARADVYETYDIAYSGASFNNSATATGTITLDLTAFGADPTDVTKYSSGPRARAPISDYVSALSLTVSGASVGNGTFTEDDYSYIRVRFASVNMTTQIVGQAGLIDFSLFPSDTSSAPFPDGMVNIITDGGLSSGDSLALTSLVPVAAPEPSQVISMLSLAGMGGAGLLLKLRRRK